MRRSNEYEIVAPITITSATARNAIATDPSGYIHNGADDNASGRRLAAGSRRRVVEIASAPRRTILFAFWDGEEKGLLGSKHWASNPTMPLDRIK